MDDQPFDSIESAHEFLSLLSATIDDTVRDLQGDLQSALDDSQLRRVEAVNLALYKLKLLDTHVHKSQRILNDLRTLRRLLYSERSAALLAE